jgi:hypothetical protein
MFGIVSFNDGLSVSGPVKGETDLASSDLIDLWRNSIRKYDFRQALAVFEEKQSQELSDRTLSVNFLNKTNCHIFLYFQHPY